MPDLYFCGSKDMYGPEDGHKCCCKHVPKGWSCGLGVCEDGWHMVPYEYSVPCPYYPEKYIDVELRRAEYSPTTPLEIATRDYMNRNGKKLMDEIFNDMAIANMFGHTR